MSGHGGRPSNAEPIPGTGISLTVSSVTVIVLQDSDVTIFGSDSVARYTPENEMDFGTLTCWGSNSVGPGLPCVYHLLPIRPPRH